MKKLKFKLTIIDNSENIHATWNIINEECSELAYHSAFFNNLSELKNAEYSIKQSLVDVINAYFGETIYEIDEQIIPEDFYDKTQYDGRNAVNNLMRELSINSYVNNLPRNINRHIEDTFKPVTDALMWGWWKTAKEKCEELIPLIDNVIITQQLYDKIYNTICNYINTNYPY